MPQLEIRRHTANDGDALTREGVAAAVAIGSSLTRRYAIAVSSGAQRATQTVGCLLAGAGLVVPRGVVVHRGIRSGDEDRWRKAFSLCGSGHLDDLAEVDPEWVDVESVALGGALREVAGWLEGDEVALVVGHSPTNEAAVRGLTGETIDPLGKGEGVLVDVTIGGGRVLERLPA